MEQKIKFILIGLIGIAAICFFLFIQTLNSKQLILRERDELRKENASLNTKLEQMGKSLRDYESKIVALNSDLDKITKDKQEVDKRLELASKEKEQLIERLKSRQAHAITSPSPQSQATPAAATTDVYWAGILKAKADLELQVDNLREELKSTQMTNEQLAKEKNNLELEVKNLARESEDLKRQLEYNQKLTDSLSQEFVRERNDRNKIDESFKLLKKENMILTRQLQSLNNQRFSLERKFQELQDDKASLEHRLAEMETKLMEKLSQQPKAQLETTQSSSYPAGTALKKEESPESAISKPREQSEFTQGAGVSSQNRESVELPPIVVRTQSQAQALIDKPPAQQQQEQLEAIQSGVRTVPLENKEVPGELQPPMVVHPLQDTIVTLGGSVLAINRDSNFVIIDLGEDAGLKLGDKLQVYREGKSIADIEVIQTRKNIAACDIRNETTPIKIGDAIR